MNDQQFEALLASLSKITESIDSLAERVAVVAAMIGAVGDPDGWAEAQQMANDEDDDLNEDDDE